MLLKDCRDMSYSLLPSPPEEYKRAAAFATARIQKHHAKDDYFEKAISVASKYYQVDSEKLAQYVRMHEIVLLLRELIRSVTYDFTDKRVDDLVLGAIKDKEIIRLFSDPLYKIIDNPAKWVEAIVSNNLNKPDKLQHSQQ